MTDSGAGLSLFAHQELAKEAVTVMQVVEAGLLWLYVAMYGGCLVVLGAEWRGLRGTTLRPCLAWATAAVIATGVAGSASDLVGQEVSAASQMLHFAAAVLLLCPTVALFGAKRPQVLAWQVVVLAFWIVLSLPAFEAWFRGRGETLAIDPIRSYFLVGLIGMGIVNYLPTRYAPAAMLLAAAQSTFGWSYRPWAAPSAPQPPHWIVSVLLLATAVAGWRCCRRLPRGYPTSECAAFFGLNRAWRDFRDAYGLIWAMRVKERMNAQAAKDRWPVELTWREFVVRQIGETADAPADDASERQPSAPASQPSVAEIATVQRSLCALLRRFVSAEWIEKRLQNG